MEKERRVKQNYTCSRKEFCKCRTVMLNDLHGFKYLGEAGNPFPAFNHNVTFFVCSVMLNQGFSGAFEAIKILRN